MNQERILELANRANEDVGLTFKLEDAKQLHELMEKFAELIVQECVKEIEFQYGGGSDQPMDSEWDRAIECASSMVKYRFGVEE